MVASSTISDRNEILWKWKRKYVQFWESILHGCNGLIKNSMPCFHLSWQYQIHLSWQYQRVQIGRIRTISVIQGQNYPNWTSFGRSRSKLVINGPFWWVLYSSKSLKPFSMFEKLHVGEDRNDLIKNFDFNCIILGRKFGIKGYFSKRRWIFPLFESRNKRGSECVTPPRQLIESDLDETMLWQLVGMCNQHAIVFTLLNLNLSL